MLPPEHDLNGGTPKLKLCLTLLTQTLVFIHRENVAKHLTCTNLSDLRERSLQVDKNCNASVARVEVYYILGSDMSKVQSLGSVQGK